MCVFFVPVCRCQCASSGESISVCQSFDTVYKGQRVSGEVGWKSNSLRPEEGVSWWSSEERHREESGVRMHSLLEHRSTLSSSFFVAYPRTPSTFFRSFRVPTIALVFLVVIVAPVCFVSECSGSPVSMHRSPHGPSPHGERRDARDRSVVLEGIPGGWITYMILLTIFCVGRCVHA